MLGYKKNGDGYLVVNIEKDNEGNPMIPEGVILTPPPEGKIGKSLTIDNGEWTYFDNFPGVDMTLEDYRREKLIIYNVWEKKYVERLFIFEGDLYPNDSRFKEMMNSAINAFQTWGRLPKLWISATRKIVSPVTKEFLNGLGETAYIEQEESISVAISLLHSIQEAKSISEINDIKFPVIKSINELAIELSLDGEFPNEEESIDYNIDPQIYL